MKGWNWLTKHDYKRGFVVRVLVKALTLFLAANLFFALSDPLPAIGHLSVYNWLVRGRERLPYGESNAAYNLSIDSLDAMFSSHTIAQPKQADEYRVMVMGDSSVWGVLLDNADTLTGNLNAAGLHTCNKQVKVYNLGHPIMSATKDLILLDYAMQYQPDLIVWMVTLESLPYPKQIDAPLVQHNAARVRPLIERYQLNLDANDPRFVGLDFWGRTLVGQRRALADWWRLQLYGVNWGATGIDQLYKNYEPRSNDFDTDTKWQGFIEEMGFEKDDIAVDVLEAGRQLAGDIPVMIINEPIYIADGLNSDHRYNFWYPKWAYDHYRDILKQVATDNQWRYVDLWDSISPSAFTDSPVHLNPQGSAALSQLVSNAIAPFLNALPS